MSQVIILSKEEMHEIIESSVRRGVVIALKETGAQFRRMDFTEKECAEILRVKPETLRQWRYLKRGPRFRKSGRSVLYARKDVEAWLTAQGRETSESVDLNAMADRLLEGNHGTRH